MRAHQVEMMLVLDLAKIPVRRIVGLYPGQPAILESIAGQM